MWSLGADGAIIEAAYKLDSSYQRPAFKSPNVINEHNFNEHLGDERYYQAYRAFFTRFIQDKGIPAAVEEFIFSHKANLGPDPNLSIDKRPQMLDRFLSGLLHPIIHTGYGAEFWLPGMVVEGLAETAVHVPTSTDLIPASLFEDAGSLGNVAASAGEAIGSAFSSTVHAFDHALDTVLPRSLHLNTDRTGSTNYPPASAPPRNIRLRNNEGPPNTHALTILARVLRDPRFAPSATTERDDAKIYAATIKLHAPAIVEYAAQWTINLEALKNGKGEVERKVEELAWTVCLLYGVGGWTGRGKERFNADFFFLHLVTSSTFLPSILAIVSPHSQARFLRAYLTVVLTIYVARGRPSLDLPGFFSEPLGFTPPGAQPSPHEGVLPSVNAKEAVTPNPFLSIIQTSIVHPDEHLPKVQRSLATWAQMFGTRVSEVTKQGRLYVKSDTPGLAGMQKKSDAGGGGEAAGLGMGWGMDAFTDDAEELGEYHASHLDAEGRADHELVATELPGAEYIDGTLFFRTAELTANRMGWVREGQKPGEFWDFRGFYGDDDKKAVRRAKF